MRYRTLGRTGIDVSEVGYGAWGIGGKQWLGATDADSLAALRRAFELGLNFIDTALAYGEGHSEQLVGDVVRDAPHQVYIATKVPPKNQVWPAQPGSRIEDVFPYEYIIECTNRSLRNLKIDTIDVQQLHVWNPEWIERDEWRRAFEDLRQAGKVRFVGVSINDHQPATAIELVKTGLIDTVQVIYNIFDPSPAHSLFPVTLEHNIGVIARVPFDEGSLTGQITETSEFEGNEFRSMYFRGDRKKQVVERVNKLKSDLGSEAEPLAELALRFCLSNPAVSSVIPGMRSIRNVEMNCSVSDKGLLNETILGKLRHHAWKKNFYS